LAAGEHHSLTLRVAIRAECLMRAGQALYNSSLLDRAELYEGPRRARTVDGDGARIATRVPTLFSRTRLQYVYDLGKHRLPVNHDRPRNADQGKRRRDRFCRRSVVDVEADPLACEELASALPDVAVLSRRSGRSLDALSRRALWSWSRAHVGPGDPPPPPPLLIAGRV